MAPTEEIPFDDEDLDEAPLDLRVVSATQIACPGADLADLLCYDEAATPELIANLGFTYGETEDPEGEFTEPYVEGIDLDAYYLITFPDGTDLEDFSIADALAVELFSEKCFNELAVDEAEMACDGDCDNCPQDCIGKQPVE